jgi:hypothetical protein
MTISQSSVEDRSLLLLGKGKIGTCCGAPLKFFKKHLNKKEQPRQIAKEYYQSESIKNCNLCFQVSHGIQS